MCYPFCRKHGRHRAVKRRDFIVLIGGAAAWPLAAHAQQDRRRRIGVLMSTRADDPEGQTRIAAFLGGLQQLGWTDGRNVEINTRWATGDAEGRKYAAELVALAPDVILGTGLIQLCGSRNHDNSDRFSHRRGPPRAWFSGQVATSLCPKCRSLSTSPWDLEGEPIVGANLRYDRRAPSRARRVRQALQRNLARRPPR